MFNGKRPLMKECDLAEVRFMRDSDILQVKEIERECKLSGWSADDYKKELIRRDAVTLILTLNENIIGFTVARLIKFNLLINSTIKNQTEKSQKVSEAEAEAEIYNIAVKNQYQNQGYGQKLLNRFIKICSSNRVNNIWLEVRKSNTGAIAFYNRNGFLSAYCRKNFYTAPTEDAIVLRLIL